MMDWIAGILVGGQSRRMGRDKALLPLGDLTMLESVYHVVSRVVRRVVLVGAPPFALPPAMNGASVITDYTPGLGPIGGLEALLTHAAGADGLLIACDMPNLNEALLRRLTDTGLDGDAVVPTTLAGHGRRRHPCCAAYRASALSVVRAAIAAGGFALHDLLNRLRVQTIDLSDDEAKWVENWNRPADLPLPAATRETAR
jgi:molybdopterin-guanine dinucleotide biosynthesis protein A